MRVTWLPDVLQAADLTVMPVDGWQGRGHVLSTINGVVLHHTATPATMLDANVAKILRDGRADLAGPLAQLGLDRQGRFWLICDGKANHNGYGMWANQSIGIEAFNNGVGEPWPVPQLDAWQRGTAAILAHLHLNEGHALGHRETDPKRKIDPKGVDLEAFRRRVAQLLRPTMEDLMRDERIIEIPAPNTDGLQLVDHDDKGNGLGLFSTTSSVQVCASREGHLTRLYVEPFPYIDALVLAVSNPDGTPATPGRKARIVIEHR
jgi:hypothetical protein